MPLTDYCPATSLVDQVIDVDNLVTKLLKVLRIIQLENDTCIQELKDEKYEILILRILIYFYSLMFFYFYCRTEIELRLEILLSERKVAEYSHEPEKEIYSNGVIDRTSILENCKHVFKELKHNNYIFMNENIINHHINNYR